MASTLPGSRITEITFNCLFAAGIIVTNLTLVTLILLKKELRTNSKYVIILFLAITDLFIGIFSIPVVTHILVTQSLDLPCLLTKILAGFNIVQTGVSLLGILSVNLDTIFQTTMRAYTGVTRKALCFILILLFLGVPVVILTPIFLNGQSPQFAPNCNLSLDVTFARAAVICSYWGPVATVVFTTIFAVVVHHRKRRENYSQFGGQQHIQTQTNMSSLGDVIIAASISVASYLPSEVLTLTGVVCVDCTWFFILIVVFQYLTYCKPLFLPIIWAAHREFRSIVRGRQHPIQANQIPVGQTPVVHYSKSEYLGSPIATDYSNTGDLNDSVIEPMK